MLDIQMRDSCKMDALQLGTRRDVNKAPVSNVFWIPSFGLFSDPIQAAFWALCMEAFDASSSTPLPEPAKEECCGIRLPAPERSAAMNDPNGLLDVVLAALLNGVNESGMV